MNSWQSWTHVIVHIPVKSHRSQKVLPCQSSTRVKVCSTSDEKRVAAETVQLSVPHEQPSVMDACKSSHSGEKPSLAESVAMPVVNTGESSTSDEKPIAAETVQLSVPHEQPSVMDACESSHTGKKPSLADSAAMPVVNTGESSTSGDRRIAAETVQLSVPHEQPSVMDACESSHSGEKPSLSESVAVSVVNTGESSTSDEKRVAAETVQLS